MPKNRADLDPFIARDWSEDDKHNLYEVRRLMLIETNRADGVLQISELAQDPAKLIGALSLVQEGFLRLDPQSPELLQLTEDGRNFAIGTIAFEHGWVSPQHI
jgi:hypothetical protein